MITENSLGQKINNPERFWKWFGNSITVDEQGRPRVFYHGTRQKFDTFKSEYRDNLIFFSYDEKFAQDWSRNARINDDQKQAYEEIEDKVYAYGKEIYKRFKEKYGEDWLENEDLKDQYYKEKEEYKEQLLKEINLEKKVLGCYLKVSKLFIPERDSDLVLDEIIKYYHWEDKWDLDDKIEVASENFQKVNNEFEEWLKNNKNAPEEEKKEQNRKLDDAYRERFSLKNEKAQFENDLKRIKQGAWIYFEHGNVIDKIYELGYDGIQLSESGGEQTTIAVRPNQIKSVNNKGGYNSSENIYEDYSVFKMLNEKLEAILEEAAMYKFNKPTFKDFYEYVIKNPKCKKCYFEITYPYNLRIASDTIIHDFNKHKTTFKEWDDCLSNIENIQNADLSKKKLHSSKADVYLLHIIGKKDYGIVLQIENKYNLIRTLFIDHPNSIDNWIRTDGAGVLTSQLSAPDTSKGSSVTISSQPSNDIIQYILEKIKR